MPRSAAASTAPTVKLVDDQGQGDQLPEHRHPGGVRAARRAPCSAWRTVRAVAVGDVLATHAAGDARRLATSPAVCRASRTSSRRGKPEGPGDPRRVLAAPSSFGKETKGKRRLVITDEEGEEHEELIPKWRHLNVFEGEKVLRGEIIADGEPNPHDILRLQGVESAGRLPGARDPGRLSAPGREDQRQAHRGHHSPDAAQGRDHRHRATRASCAASRSIAHRVDRGESRGRRQEGQAGDAASPCCSASRRLRSRPSRSSRRPRSRRRRACSTEAAVRGLARRSARPQGERHRRAG